MTSGAMNGVVHNDEQVGDDSGSDNEATKKDSPFIVDTHAIVATEISTMTAVQKIRRAGCTSVTRDGCARPL